LKGKSFLSALNPIRAFRQHIAARVIEDVEKRAAQSFTQIQTAKQYLSVLGLYDNSSGEYVSNDGAMRIATAFTCVDLRSSSVGMLPANVLRYKNQNSDSKETAWDHWSYRLIHNRPNPWQTAAQFWKCVVQRVDIDGECFATITRGENPRIDIQLHSDVVVRCGDNDNNPYYEVKGRPVEYSNILHFKDVPSRDGKRGLSKIELHQETFGSAKRQKKYSNRSLNVIPPFYMSTPGNVSIKEEGIKSLKEKLSGQVSDYFEDGSLPILTNGMKVETVGLKPVDAAYLEQMNGTKEDVCGIFHTPPALVNAFKTGVTYNNLEQQNLQFLIYGLSPMLTNIEQEVNEKLFLSREQGKYFMKFNTGALLRADLKTQSEWFTAMFKIGVYSQNKILDILDENPIEGGDRHYVEGNNMVPIDMIDELIKSKQSGGTTKLTEETKKRLKERFNGHTEEIIKFFES
jgi:HK97 family phage portal protein